MRAHPKTFQGQLGGFQADKESKVLPLKKFRLFLSNFPKACLDILK
jgi:hypothetical protein